MATNINYPVNLPCPLLSGNTHQPGNTFIRSEFDYAIRQRKQYCAQYSVGFSFVIKSQIQMETFKDFFYNTLNYGVNSFLADWEIEGMDGIKEFRFSSNYTTVALGANRYRITASFDMITKIKGLFVIPSIQYSMDVVSTELDGTRYIKNDGKGGSSFNAEAFASNHIYLNGTTQSVPYPTLASVSFFTYFDSITNTLKRFGTDIDYGDGLIVPSSIYSVTDSHQFVFNHTSPLSAEGKAAIEADPNLAFRMFFDGEVLPSGFSNTDVGWFSGGNEGLASAEKVYDLSDQSFLTYVSIIDYDALTRTTLDNKSNGASNLKLVQDGSGRTTGIAVVNTTQWEADGRTAVTNWTVSAPFTVTEEIDGDTYTFTSDGNRYKNTVADGTYTLPTGIWALDEFGFDGITPVTARGITKKVNEIVVP